MGWRYRKSINLGLGFRINLSKSGIGYSWGFPGYRTTKLANGGTRQTYSIPGTGISYVEQQGKNSRNTNSETGLYTGETENFKNIPIDELKNNDPILKKINKVLLLNRLANLLLLLTLLIPIYPGFVLSFFAGVIIKIIIARSNKIGLYYEFDDESRKMFNSLKEVLIILSKSRKIWQVSSSTRVYNTKYNAGAGHNINRNSAYVTSKMPWFIKTNINVYGLSLRNQKMFFTPDRVLVFRPFGKVFGCTYNDMFLGIKTTRFVESERVCNDAEIVDYTWRYANHDGGRDLRFSGNRRLPVCKYGEFTIKSPNGINTVVEFSNHKLSDDIQSNLILFGNQFNRILAKTKGILKEEKGDEESVEEIENKEEKIIVTDVSQLLNNGVSKSLSKNEEAIVTTIQNKEYKLPKINLLSSDESKSTIPFIEKMRSQKKTFIPIGLQQEELIIEDIGSMPNMLIGGTVMSGKTAYINTIITSFLLTKKPSDLKLVIYDSKKVDYAVYNGIPHLLCPVITDSKKLSIVLQRMCIEIENRTEKLRTENLKNIDLLNNKLSDDKRIPDIVIIIDDFSTLNVTDEINDSIEYITSNGWNVNVYVIVSANHPSARVIPTVSKSNFPARLSFKVASSQASQIILDQNGAEKLSGFGNALYSSRMNSKILKLKVPYIPDEDITKVVNYCINEQQTEYLSDIIRSHHDVELENKTKGYEDPMYNEVVEFAVTTGKISASLLQRRFRFGYNRACMLIDQLEANGIIGPANGSKPREVLVRIDEDGE